MTPIPIVAFPMTLDRDEHGRAAGGPLRDGVNQWAELGLLLRKNRGNKRDGSWPLGNSE